ncbi:MAG: L-threonylcarbamoyladenylate synthase [Saprospiraceae bacterium]|jgi:L-threonylcarbamoyladenylate synthase
MLKKMKHVMLQAIQVLNNGGIIIYPTETVLGIGCLSLNASAVNKIYQIKKRDTSKAMLVLVDSLAMVKRYKKTITKTEKSLLLSEKPTTVLFDNVLGFPNELTGKNNSLAFRITKNDQCLELIHAINQPLVSTSANLSGEPTVNNPDELPSELTHKVDFIIKKHTNDNRQKPSRIVKVVNDKIIYIRK